jgi:hypothetical protein
MIFNWLPLGTLFAFMIIVFFVVVGVIKYDLLIILFIFIIIIIDYIRSDLCTNRNNYYLEYFRVEFIRFISIEFILSSFTIEREEINI